MKTTTLPTKQVREALKILAPAVSRRATLDILKTILIETRGQITTLTATDLDHYAQVQLKHEMRLPLRICVPLDDIKQSVAAAGDQCTLMAFSAITSASDFPPLPHDLIASPTITVPTAPILEAYAACSKDETRFAICGVGLDGEHCVGTDGRRLYARRGFNFTPLLDPIAKKSESDKSPLKLRNHRAIQAFIKAADAISITAHYEKDAIIAESSLRWLQVQTPNATIYCKHDSSQFPNWKMVVPSLGGHSLNYKTITATYDPSYALDALKSLPNIKTQSIIQWKVRNGISSFCIPAANGFLEAKFFCQANGELDISYNRDFLATALAQGFGEVHFRDETSPAEFQKPEAFYVLMPCRKAEPVEEPEPAEAAA
jgi:DNA polymerase III sliding clamp (beta) subunit (PCNA family)